MTLKQYEAKISQTTTDKEITNILYSAFLQDGNALYGKNTLYSKVIKMCLKRSAELESQ